MLGKLFYVAIACGLIFNLLSDLSVYRQSKIEAGTGRWVEESYQILSAIDSAKIKLFESQAKESVDPGIRVLFERLRASLQELPNQKERANALLALVDEDLLSTTDNRAMKILSEMGSAEINLLEDRLKRDRDDRSSAANQIVIANILDLLLMIIVFGFFVYERKAAGKMQSAMTSALAHVESVNQSLLKSISRKDSKLKTTVHDLKNPLGSIKGFAELLQDEAGNSISTLEMVRIIQRISVNTLTLVDSVLHTEEEDEDDEMNQKEELSVLDCLTETCRFLEPIARSKKQSLVMDGATHDFTYWASRQKLQDIFYNLIGNALKYSPPGATILINSRDVKGDGNDQDRDRDRDRDRIENQPNVNQIEIIDQGPGFTDEDFSRMFTPGVTLSAKPTGGESSSGIGLYSVKNSLNEIHATLDIKNHGDCGACVILTFPTVLPAASPTIYPHNPALNLHT